MLEICQKLKEVDDQGAEGESFFKISSKIFIFKWSCTLALMNVNLDILDRVLKQFKDSSEMAIKNMVSLVLQNPPTRTRNE